VTGLDALRKTYHDLKRAARKEGVPFQSWCKPHEQGTFLPDEGTAPGPGEDAEDASESEDSDDDDQMPEPISPITAPSPKRRSGTRTKRDSQMRAGVARVIRRPENKLAEKGEEPISPGRRAERIGKKVMVSSEESEEVPLQVNRGKGRPEKAGKPLPFTAMLGLGNRKTRLDCDPGLEAEMRLLGCLEEEEEQQQWTIFRPTQTNQRLPFSRIGGPARNRKTSCKRYFKRRWKKRRKRRRRARRKEKVWGKKSSGPRA
jgi:hypothetical protein